MLRVDPRGRCRPGYSNGGRCARGKLLPNNSPTPEHKESRTLRHSVVTLVVLMLAPYTYHLLKPARGDHGYPARNTSSQIRSAMQECLVVREVPVAPDHRRRQFEQTSPFRTIYRRVAASCSNSSELPVCLHSNTRCTGAVPSTRAYTQTPQRRRDELQVRATFHGAPDHPSPLCRC